MYVVINELDARFTEHRELLDAGAAKRSWILKFAELEPLNGYCMSMGLSLVAIEAFRSYMVAGDGSLGRHKRGAQKGRAFLTNRYRLILAGESQFFLLIFVLTGF